MTVRYDRPTSSRYRTAGRIAVNALALALALAGIWWAALTLALTMVLFGAYEGILVAFDLDMLYADGEVRMFGDLGYTITMLGVIAAVTFVRRRLRAPFAAPSL